MFFMEWDITSADWGESTKGEGITQRSIEYGICGRRMLRNGNEERSAEHKRSYPDQRMPRFSVS
jgi:hypothetical protein